MRRIRRYLLRLRPFLLILLILALSWWIALQASDRETLHRSVADHEGAAMYYQGIAESPIGDRVAGWAMGPDRRCGWFERPRSEAEMIELTRLRDRAARRAAHHRALVHKYELAVWFPWLPPATDPAEPE
jgi:4-amino-4-deoxy-L-arabinose transferase-like glycosyltransferase